VRLSRGFPTWSTVLFRDRTSTGPKNHGSREDKSVAPMPPLNCCPARAFDTSRAEWNRAWKDYYRT
jgi:hypothetical protein